MNKNTNDEIRGMVREAYGQIVRTGSDCGCSASGCCGAANGATPREVAVALGYSPEDLNSLPVGANLGLGCGNPNRLASLRLGETVLDLGSGSGLDCFLAARAVGEEGQIIGVDMTAEMIERARENARQLGLNNVQFRPGEVENLPVADDSVDVVLSNCVINLSPEKERAFAEAFRVLKPGGRLRIADVVARAELPGGLKQSPALYTGCVSGAILVPELELLLRRVGFEAVEIRVEEPNQTVVDSSLSKDNLGDCVASATIEAVKPAVEIIHSPFEVAKRS